MNRRSENRAIDKGRNGSKMAVKKGRLGVAA